MIKAILLDFDGVVADSEPIHYRSHKYALEKQGIKLSQEDYIKLGSNVKSIIFYKSMEKLHSKKIDFDLAKKDRWNNFSENLNKINLVTGVKKFLENSRKKFKLALVTAAPKEYAVNVLKQNEALKYFDLVISGRDLKNNKPHPEPYLHAVKKLNLKPNECIIIEDSTSGVSCGKRAKIFTVGLKTKYGKMQNLSRANLQTSNFKQLNVGELKL